jgi:hypothetical protein
MEKNTVVGSSSFLVVIAVVGALVAPHLKNTDSSSVSGRNGASSEQRFVAKGNSVAIQVQPEQRTPSPKERLDLAYDNLVENAIGLQRHGPGDDLNVEKSPRVYPLVVSLPDPGQSHLATYYDQALVALRQAAETFGYVPDRFALPWQHNLGASNTTTEEESTEAARQLPGLMLFRRDPHNWLVAVVVTESPVRGVSVPQMELALRFARQRASGKSVGVLGPFFSGSESSFIAAIDHVSSAFVGEPPASAQGPAFTVVTGTATGKLAQFDVLAKAQPPRLEFSRTIPTDEYLFNWLTQQLDVYDPRPQLARLSELGTGYGAGAERASVPNFKFPLHISDVRTEHERIEGAGADLFPSLRRTLGLRPNSADGRESDIPATVSSRTAVEDDLTLAQLFTAICTQHFRYLLIEATDPADVAFLAKESRKYCQNLTLVTLGFDEMYLHPDNGPVLSGALVVAPYAPSLEVSLFTGRALPHPFPNSVSQGFFNAAIKLLPSEYAPKTPSHGFLGYRCLEKSRSESPSCGWEIYLSRISGSRAWPLQAQLAPIVPIPTAASLPPMIRSSEVGQHAHSTRAVRFIALPVLFAAAAHLLGRWTRRGLFAECQKPWRAVRERRVFVADVSLALVVALAGLPLTLLIFAGPKYAPKFPSPAWIAGWVGMGLTALLLFATASSLVKVVKRLRRAVAQELTSTKRVDIRNVLGSWVQRTSDRPEQHNGYIRAIVVGTIGLAASCLLV